MTSKTPPDRIPDEGIAPILARAAELDRTARDSVPRNAVTIAALEAGIGLEAVETALEEYAAGAIQPAPAAPVEQSGGRLPRWARPLANSVKYAWLGAAAGWLGIVIEDAPPGAGTDPGFLIPLLAMLFVAGRIVLRDRPTRSASPFLLTFGAMAFGVLVGSLTVNDGSGIVEFLLLVALALLVLGTGAIKLGSHKMREASST